ncbi:MAG: hypothetical protein AAGF47_10710 [Planctomycetota bacterium]
MQPDTAETQAQPKTPEPNPVRQRRDYEFVRVTARPFPMALGPETRSLPLAQHTAAPAPRSA